jgi:hypothetical protein
MTDDSNLRDNGGNPHANGTPGINGSASAGTDRFSSSPGASASGPAQGAYYQNPPASGAGNPYSAGGPPDINGATTDLGMGGGLDAVYREALSEQPADEMRGGRENPSQPKQPTILEYYIDNGAGFDEAVPPDRQR